MNQANPQERPPAYVITGPTSGIGYRTALELAAHGTVVLAGRDRAKLDQVQRAIEGRGGRAASVACDLSDLPRVGARPGRSSRWGCRSRGCSTTPGSCRPSRRSPPTTWAPSR